MFCPHCGTETQDDHAYCHACGSALPAARRRTPQRVRGTGMLSTLGVADMRFFVYGIGGMVAILLIADLLRAVALVALPLLVVLAIVYWARERRRRYY